MSQLSTPSPIRAGLVSPNVWDTLMRNLELEDGLPPWAVRDTWVKNDAGWGRVRDIRAGVITIVGWKRDVNGRIVADSFTVWPADWAAWEPYDPDRGLPSFGGPARATRYERDFEP